MASHLSDPPPRQSGNWSVEADADVWRAFVAARSDEEFCQTWLALLCRQLPGIKGGVVLFQATNANTFAPVAIWPEVTRDLSFLGKVAERALVERRGVVHRPSAAADAPVYVAYPIEVSGRLLGSVVLDSVARTEPEIHALLRQLHWGMAWLNDLSRRRELTAVEARLDRIGSVMEVIATALSRQRLQQTLFDVANHIARQLRCARVAIGLVNERKVRVTTLSNAAWFEKNAALVKLYAAAMEEAYDRLTTLTYYAPESNNSAATEETMSAHARLARESGARASLSVPLQLGSDCIAVLTLERDSDEPFDAGQTAWVEALATLLPAAIDHKRRAERGYTARVRDDSRTLATRLFGPRHLVWKLSATLLFVLFAALALVDIDYRVAAKTVIEGDTQRAIVAPFESFVATSHVRAGDIVRQGQVLCTLDDNDLLLEQHKWKSETEQASRKLREAMAKHDLAAVQVLNAQLQQTEAQLALVRERLARVTITAPFDGVVMSGDLSQLVGSPVEQGKKLFEIAPLQSYRVVLQVDEHDVRHVDVGQRGKLVIAGIASDSLPFQVSKVTPVAMAQDGRNFFRIEARLDQAPPGMRPGMEGVGKITVGERRLWWILTHGFTDWLRLTLWTWLP